MENYTLEPNEVPLYKGTVTEAGKTNLARSAGKVKKTIDDVNEALGTLSKKQRISAWIPLPV